MKESEQNKSILLKSVYFDDYIVPKITGDKGERNSSQSSNVANGCNEMSISQSEMKLPCTNIQLTIAYGHGISYIIKMGEHSNVSQRNKGDIAEMVSLPFTCQLGPDGKYIRNYLSTHAYEVRRLYWQFINLPPTTHNRVEIVLCYIPPIILTEQTKKDYEKCKKHKCFSMLLPTNDFVKAQSYPIASNIPAVDNSIAIYTIANKHILMIVRQDKIGYDVDEIRIMVTNGIQSLVEGLEHWQQFKDYKIELIYTLAWSRKQNKAQHLISPIKGDNSFMGLLIVDIYNDLVNCYYESSYRKKLMQRLSISVFAENCLSDNVIADSAKIYEEFGKQYPAFSEQCQNTSKALKELIHDKEFHDIYDTAQYELFLPDERFLEDLDTIESYVKKISMQCLQQRMLSGLEQLKSLQKTQKQAVDDTQELQASDSIIESYE